MLSSFLIQPHSTVSMTTYCNIQAASKMYSVFIYVRVTLLFRFPWMKSARASRPAFCFFAILSNRHRNRNWQSKKTEIGRKKNRKTKNKPLSKYNNYYLYLMFIFIGIFIELLHDKLSCYALFTHKYEKISCTSSYRKQRIKKRAFNQTLETCNKRIGWLRFLFFWFPSLSFVFGWSFFACVTITFFCWFDDIDKIMPSR